ncbi:MAG: glycosyltransferase family 39 protein [Chloroflexi bacterium]|nr:glycosyltransferase family 39 protein [Chloroflexota bacterium]
MTTTYLQHDQPESLAEEKTLSSIVTIEVALFAALAFSALFLRLFLLGNVPLADDEARQAIASWNFARNIPDAYTGSPLLFTGNAIIFFLFGATDAAARLLAALFGSALVLLPALLRRELGRIGALIASALLTFSPSLVLFSRDVNGAIIAVTCALTALVFAWRYLTDHSPRALSFAAVSAALALLAAREVWTVIVALIVVGAIFRKQFQFASESHSDLRRAGILFALVFFGVGTTALMHRDGIGAAFDLLTAWINGLTPSFSFSDPLRLLVVYEPIAFFFGVAAIVQLAFLARSDERDTLPLDALSIWFIVGFILYSLGGDKNPARVVAVVVPLALITGWYLGAWIQRAAASTWLENLLAQELPIYVLACALAGFLYLVLAEFSTRGTFVAADVIGNLTGLKSASGLIIALLISIAVAVIAFLTVTTTGWARAKDIALAIGLTLLIGWTFRQTITLNFRDSNSLNPQEFLVARAASSSVRDLVDDLAEISRYRANDSHTIRVVADESLGAMLAWYLRDFRYVQFSARPSATSEAQALILPSDADAPASGWMSQTYRLETARNATPLPSLLRWLMYRDVGATDNASAALWLPQPK